MEPILAVTEGRGRLAVYHGANTERKTTIHTHSPTYGLFRITKITVGLWEEARVPEENRWPPTGWVFICAPLVTMQIRVSRFYHKVFSHLHNNPDLF